MHQLVIAVLKFVVDINISDIQLRIVVEPLLISSLIGFLSVGGAKKKDH